MTDQEKIGFIKSNLIYIILLVVVFLLGLTITGWQWWQTSSELEATNKQLTETTQKLEREKIKGLIAAAIVETQRGEFELALKDASSFFTDLRNEVDKADDSAFLVEEKTQLKAILNERDQAIASIAKQDKDVDKRLINIYLAYRNAIGEASQGSGNISKEDLDNSNTSNQTSDNTESDQQDSKNENSENSDVREDKNENANVETPQVNSGDLKKPEANVKNENSANSNGSSKF